MNTLQNKWESRQIEHIFYADIVQHGTKSANTCNLTTLNNTGELLALRQVKKKKKKWGHLNVERIVSLFKFIDLKKIHQ